MKRVILISLMGILIFATYSSLSLAVDCPNALIKVKFTGKTPKLPPVMFDHSIHDSFECQNCHHKMDKEKDMQCGICHKVVKSETKRKSEPACNSCHAMVMSKGVACVDCHQDIGKEHKRTPQENCFGCHDAVKGKVACAECHDKPRPESYSNAFHALESTRSCLGCHNEMGAGPTECFECHHKK